MDGSRATSDLNLRGEPRIRSRFDTTTTAAEVLASMDQGGKRALVTRGAGGHRRLLRCGAGFGAAA